MKISENLNTSAGVPELLGREDRRVHDSGETSFQGQLKRVESTNYEEKIRGLVSKIIEQGEKLGERTDIRELKIYKNLISEFLDETLNNSHKFMKKNFLDRRGRHRVYSVVKKVNEELESLTKEVLNSEQDNIKILNCIDDIRGLILDLSM